MIVAALAAGTASACGAAADPYEPDASDVFDASDEAAASDAEEDAEAGRFAADAGTGGGSDR